MAARQTLGGDTIWPSPKRIQKTNTKKTQKNIGGYGIQNKKQQDKEPQNGNAHQIKV